MFWKVILLGIIQGITEFLPVSSTAHLVLVEKLLKVSEESFGLAFDVSLHIGTTLALIIFFWKTWRGLVFSITQKSTEKRQKGNEESRLAVNLVIATIPAVLVGVFLENDIKRVFREPFWISIFLILFSLVFFVAEKCAKKKKELKEMKIGDALIIGLNQAIALLPGVSRSGITISAGLLTGLKRDEAGRFAFLLSTPIIIGAFLKEHSNILSLVSTLATNGWLFIGGMTTSFFIGLLTLKYFLQYLNKRSLIPFIIYRIILGVLIILLLI